jgi:hypothetical protein
LGDVRVAAERRRPPAIHPASSVRTEVVRLIARLSDKANATSAVVPYCRAFRPPEWFI